MSSWNLELKGFNVYLVSPSSHAPLPQNPISLVVWWGVGGGPTPSCHTLWGPHCTPIAALAPARRHAAPGEQAPVKVGGGLSTQITYPP